MAHSVNNDLVVSCLVENQVRIWRRRYAPNGGVLCHRPGQRIPLEHIGQAANSGLDATRSLW